jgi:GNAT superfamily N-acetyltransferase
MKLRRRPGRRTGEGRRRSGVADLVAVRSTISRLDTESDPDSIREVHLDLLDAFGRTIGFGFHEQPPSAPASEGLIVVFGRFDPRAREREFGLQLFTERSEDGRPVRVAWVIELYLPEGCRRQGAGTALMETLLELWERIGVAEARATTVGDGQLAFPSWGFEPDPRHPRDHSLLPLHLPLPRSGTGESDSWIG